MKAPRKDLPPLPFKIKKRKRTLILREIKKLRSTTNLLIAKAPFMRLVKETVKELFPYENYKMRTEAVGAIHEATEAFLVRLFEDAHLCTIHGRRTTLQPKDIQLVLKLNK